MRETPIPTIESTPDVHNSNTDNTSFTSPIQNITPPIDAVPTSTAFDGTPKKRNYIPWLLGILVLVVIFVTSFLILIGNQKKEEKNRAVSQVTTPTQSPISQSTTETRILYSNQKIFTINFPSDWFKKLTPISPPAGQEILNRATCNKPSFKECLDDIISIRIINNSDEKSLLTVATQRENIYNSKKQAKNIVLADKTPGLLVTGISAVDLIRKIYFTYESNVIETTLQNVGDDDVNQFISTFKLLNKYQILDTSNWKTYTNDKNGYSVKYPLEYRHIFLEDVNKNETAGGVIKSLDLDNYAGGEELHTGGTSGDNIQISIYPESGDSWSEIPAIDSSTDTVIFGGQKALREITPIPFIVIGPIKHNGKIYKIQYDIPYKESDFSNFYTMLSTFKFTN